MRVDPTRLAQALASVYGVARPRPLSTLRYVPCPVCRGAVRSLTQCARCGGSGRQAVFG